MPEPTTQAPPAPATVDNERDRDAETQPEVDLVESDLLVEDVSIDGMCGVY
jgi:mycofactocin precursor